MSSPTPEVPSPVTPLVETSSNPAQSLATKHLPLEGLIKDVSRLRYIVHEKGMPKPFPDTQLQAVKLGLELHGALKQGGVTVDNRTVNLSLSQFSRADVSGILSTLQGLASRFDAVNIPWHNPDADVSNIKESGADV